MKINLDYQGFFFAPDDAGYKLLRENGHKSGDAFELDIGSVRSRTDQQRKAIEVYCRQLAGALNAAGYDQRKVMAAMKEGTEIPWSQESVKDVLWREIQKAMLDKESTTGLDPAEVSKVYDVVNRFTADRFGVSVLFPNRWGDQ